jgi:hypothetical protein
MRKVLLTLLIAALAVVVAVAAGAVYAQRDNAHRVTRAQELVSTLEQLEIGESDYAITDAIASKFGNAPPPKDFRGRYNKENCAAPDRDDRCTYIISMNDSFLQAVLLKYQFLPRIGIREWFGDALISFSGGTVSQYSFLVWYKASNGNWRGFGAGESQWLPRYEPVQAHISDSYSVRRTEMNVESGERGFGLISALTPTAIQDERQRALHIDFSCLARGGGCAEVCDVMPEAWRDFYEKLGRSDVERLGSSYLLCRKQTK